MAIRLEIPDTMAQELIDIGVIGRHPNPRSVEARANHCARLQYHFMEYVIALMEKEMREKKMIPYNPIK